MKLRVRHFPQIPCNPYVVEVNTLEEAFVVSQTLAYYDLFLLANKHRCDYANMTTVEIWDEEEKNWLDWYDSETGIDFDEWAEENMTTQYMPEPFPEIYN